jgi:hypothetical protein
MEERHTPSERVDRAYDWSKTPLTEAILESIAIFEYDDAERVGEVLDSPLPEYIDTDALDAVVTSTQPITIEFLLAEYKIRIQDNRLSVVSTDTDYSLV